MMLKERIIGPRIYLRALTDADASQEYCGWLNDPDVNKFLATKSATVAELADYICQKNQQPAVFFFGIFVKEEDKHIGTIKLELTDPSAEKAVIAIMVGDKEYWGLGLGAEAMQILMAYAQKNMSIKKVELGVITQNTKAVRAYARLGFQQTERKNQSVRYGDDFYDHQTMVLDLENPPQAIV